MVNKSNELDETVHSLKLLTAELNSNIKSKSVEKTEQVKAEQTQSWANRVGTKQPEIDPNDSDIKQNSLKYPMVIYNIPNDINETSAVLELVSTCEILKRHISKIARLSSARKSRPVVVEFCERSAMWSFIKQLNNRRLHNTYARPYLSADELELDRKLQSELRALRAENPEAKYKIRRREVVQVIEAEGHTYYVTMFTNKIHDNPVATSDGQ